MSQPNSFNATEKVVTTLTILVGLLICSLCFTKCKKGENIINLDSPYKHKEHTSTELSHGAHNDSVAVTHTAPPIKESKEYKQLENKIQSLQAQIDKTQPTINTLQTEKTLLEEHVDRLNATLRTIATGTASGGDEEGAISAMQNLIKEKGDIISQLKQELASLTKIAASNDSQVEAFKKKIETLNMEKDVLARRSQSQLDELRQKISELENALNDSDSSKIFNKKLAEQEKQWQEKLDQLKVAHQLQLTQEIDTLNTKNDKLLMIIRKEKTKNVFAETSNELMPSAQSLVSNLDAYEGDDQTQLDTLYSGLSTLVNAERKAVVKFNKSSWTLRQSYKEKIQEVLAQSTPNSYFLAVGYADPKGSAAGNRKLSKNRATEVAEYIKPKLSDMQFTQAYYLGETSRFGAPEENRIVEIWEITQ